MEFQPGPCGLIVQRLQPGPTSTVSWRIHRAVRSAQIIPLCRGVFCPREIWLNSTPEQQQQLECVALAQRYPRHCFGEVSAAFLYDLPVFGRPRKIVLFSDTQQRRKDFRLPSGTRVELRRTPRNFRHQPAAVLNHEIKVLPPVALFASLLRIVKPTFDACAQMLALLDAALRNQLMSSSDLRRTIKKGHRGQRWLRRYAKLISGLSESPLESAAKLLLGHISFVQQATIHDQGNFLARVDFLLPDYGLIVECDGKMKYREDPDRLWAERRRESSITNVGFRILHLSWQQVFDGTAADLLARSLQAPTIHDLERHWRPPVNDLAICS